MTTDGGLEHRLREFTAKWQRTTVLPTFVDRLTDFFRRADGLLTSKSLEEPELPACERMDSIRFAQLMTGLAPLIGSIRGRSAYPNPWSASGLKRDEVRNTSALAFLWDETLNGRPARDFLEAFLVRVSPDGDPLPIRELLDDGYRVRVEDSPLGLGSERIDLTLESAEVIVGIEVKIGAGLGETQLQRYVDTVRRRAASTKRHHRVIFLAPFGSPVTEVVSASWRDVVLASRSVRVRAAERSFVHHLIECYAQHLLSWKERR